MSALKLSRVDLAALLGVSTRSIQAWQSAPGFPPPEGAGRTLRYDGPACIAWWHARAVGKLVRAADGSWLDPQQESARLDRARRLQVELANAKTREELVDAGDVRRVFAAASRQVRDAVLAVPDRVSPILAAAGDADLVHATLTAELEQALTTLADAGDRHAAEADSPGTAGADNGSGGDKAPTRRRPKK